MISTSHAPLLFRCLLIIPSLSWALPFSIAPTSGTSLPTQLLFGQSTAYYTITNNTHGIRAGNYIKYLPANVTQVTADNTISNLCGETFTLQPNNTSGSSCTLELLVSGAVNGYDPNVKHHLFACFPGGITCAGTPYPLNVVNAPSIAGGYYIANDLSLFAGVASSSNNDSSWAAQALPAPTGYNTGVINGMSRSNHHSIGVGSYLDASDNPYASVATSHDDGQTWSQQILPPVIPEANFASLNGVSCVNERCVAVGLTGNPISQAFEALIASTNNSGVTWSQQRLPELTGYAGTIPRGISCSNNFCVAVGTASDETFTQSNSWIATSTNGGVTWSQQTLNNLNNMDYQELLSVSCTPSECIAVGNYSDDNGVSHPGVAISTNHGNTWTQTTLDLLEPYGQSFYSGISCTPEYCVAVGQTDNSSGSNYPAQPAVAISTNQGASWHQSILTIPSGFTYGALTSVNCNGNTCVAAGYYQHSLSNFFPFTAVSMNKGITWTQTTTNLPAGFVQGSFNAMG